MKDYDFGREICRLLIVAANSFKRIKLWEKIMLGIVVGIYLYTAGEILMGLGWVVR